MKNLSRNFSIWALMLSLSLAAAPGMAEKKTIKIGGSVAEQSKVAGKTNQQAEEEENLEELEFAQMINSVPLDKKSSELIQKFQQKEARDKLQATFGDKDGRQLETIRNKEVLVITIPASQLFAPNDINLLPNASKLLTPIKRYLREPDMYRVLLVMHTDNTGSEVYRDYITEERSDAIFSWLEDQDADTEYLFPFAFGDDMPLVVNNSMANRAKNRRVEIYLVPGKKMLEQAKKGRIVF